MTGDFAGAGEAIEEAWLLQRPQGTRESSRVR